MFILFYLNENPVHFCLFQLYLYFFHFLVINRKYPISITDFFEKKGGILFPTVVEVRVGAMF